MSYRSPLVTNSGRVSELTSADALAIPGGLALNGSVNVGLSGDATIDLSSSGSLPIYVVGVVNDLNGADRTAYGILAPSSGGYVVCLLNTTAYTLTLAHESGSATNANSRFSLPGSAAVLLPPGAAAWFTWGGTTARWRPLSPLFLQSAADDRVPFLNDGQLATDSTLSFDAANSTLLANIASNTRARLSAVLLKQGAGATGLSGAYNDRTRSASAVLHTYTMSAAASFTGVDLGSSDGNYNGTDYGSLYFPRNGDTTYSLTLKANDAASSAANRFDMSTDLVLAPGEMAGFWHNGTKWVLLFVSRVTAAATSTGLTRGQVVAAMTPFTM